MCFNKHYHYDNQYCRLSPATIVVYRPLGTIVIDTLRLLLIISQNYRRLLLAAVIAICRQQREPLGLNHLQAAH